MLSVSIYLYPARYLGSWAAASLIHFGFADVMRCPDPVVLPVSKDYARKVSKKFDFMKMKGDGKPGEND